MDDVTSMSLGGSRMALTRFWLICSLTWTKQFSLTSPTKYCFCPRVFSRLQEGFLRGETRKECIFFYQVQSPLRSSDGQTPLNDRVSILSRWPKHFQTLFSAKRIVYDSAILRISQQPVKAELDEPSSVDETVKAIK